MQLLLPLLSLCAYCVLKLRRLLPRSPQFRLQHGQTRLPSVLSAPSQSDRQYLPSELPSCLPLSSQGDLRFLLLELLNILTVSPKHAQNLHEELTTLLLAPVCIDLAGLLKRQRSGSILSPRAFGLQPSCSSTAASSIFYPYHAPLKHWPY